MREIAKGEIAPESIQRLVQGIPFFNEIIRTDAHQFVQLTTRWRLLHAEPGDVVIRRDHSVFVLPLTTCLLVSALLSLLLYLFRR